MNATIERNLLQQIEGSFFANEIKTELASQTLDDAEERLGYLEKRISDLTQESPTQKSSDSSENSSALSAGNEPSTKPTNKPESLIFGVQS